jgi:hypothetical protein
MRFAGIRADIFVQLLVVDVEPRFKCLIDAVHVEIENVARLIGGLCSKSSVVVTINPREHAKPATFPGRKLFRLVGASLIEANKAEDEDGNDG